MFRLLALFLVFSLPVIAEREEILNKYDKVVVYQFGKVASSALVKDLRAALRVGKDYVIHNHSPKRMQEILESEDKILIINMCRNLFDRNISAYFENIERLRNKSWYLGPRNYVRSLSLEQLHEDFREKNIRHIDKISTWYRHKFDDLLDLNFFESDFDFRNKYLFITSEQFDLLVMRFEDINNWELIVKKVLDLDEFVLRKFNVASNKWYKNLYKKFKKEYKFSQEEIDKILSIDFMNYFYSDDEISEILLHYR